jgi:hypothetical protein
MGSATLDDGGHLTAGPASHGASTIHRQIGPAQLTAIEAAIADLHLEGPSQAAPPGPGCCDRGYSTLIVTIQGQTYPLPSRGSLNDLMWGLQRDAMLNAEKEYWLKAPPFDPGKVWTVTFEACPNISRTKQGGLPGLWVNSGEPKAYTGIFRDAGTKQLVHDTVTVDSVTGERISLTRQSTHTRYQGEWNPDRPDLFVFWPEDRNDPREQPPCHFVAAISR